MTRCVVDLRLCAAGDVYPSGAVAAAMSGVAMAETKGRKGRPWRRMCALVYETYPAVCWLCHHQIDTDLPETDAMSATVDHVIARDKGGSSTDINNLRPAHRRCNSRKGNRQAVRQPVTSRVW